MRSNPLGCCTSPTSLDMAGPSRAVSIHVMVSRKMLSGNAPNNRRTLTQEESCALSVAWNVRVAE